MTQPLVISGATLRLHLNNQIYKVTQSVSLQQETCEYAIYGIDSPYAQELASGGQISYRGSIRGVRIKNGGGVQAQNGRPLFSDVAASPYISIRLDDRTTGEILFSCQNAKITSIKETVGAKGTYKVDIDFHAQIAFTSIDLSYA